MEGDRSVEPALPLPRLIARCIGAGGVCAMIASVFAPWFHVPGLTGEPLWCGLYRLLPAAIIVAAIVRFPRLHRAPQRTVPGLLGLLIALLLFPYFITVWSPDYAGPASWLSAQHESLIGGSGDIYLSQETKADSWRQRVDVVNRPITSEIVDFPDWNELDLGRLFDVADWFGAAPWFAIFVGRGWVLALGGASACLLALFHECGAGSGVGARTIRRAGLVLGIAAVFAGASPAIAVWQLHAAQDFAHRGDLAMASQRLAAARSFLPALREDPTFIAQQGLFDDALRIASPEAALYRMRLLEARGFDAQAQAQHLAALRITSARAVQREHLKSLLTFAADAMNSGEVSTATTLYSTVLDHDPQNLKACYALQLAAVRHGDLARLAPLQAQMESVYRGFNLPTKMALLAFAHENHALAAALDGDPASTWQALARAHKP